MSSKARDRAAAIAKALQRAQEPETSSRTPATWESERGQVYAEASHTPHNWDTQSALEKTAMPEEHIQAPQVTPLIERSTRAMAREGDSSLIEISKESRFSGQLKFSGTVVVQGEIEGELEAVRVIIRESGIATARISGDSITIAGRVTGDVVARRELEIASTGKLNGTVTTPQMRLAPGAILRGPCNVGG